MKFAEKKRRQAPAVIIISLIDILIVLLIFLMVTTTFKQQPALKLVLPESKQAKQSGADITEQLVVFIDKQEPYFYFRGHAVTTDRLQEELKRSAQNDPETSVSLQADTKAPLGEVLKAWDSAKVAGIRRVNILTKPPGKS